MGNGVYQLNGVWLVITFVLIFMISYHMLQNVGDEDMDTHNMCSKIRNVYLYENEENFFYKCTFYFTHTSFNFECKACDRFRISYFFICSNNVQMA